MKVQPINAGCWAIVLVGALTGTVVRVRDRLEEIPGEINPPQWNVSLRNGLRSSFLAQELLKIDGLRQRKAGDAFVIQTYIQNNSRK